MIGHAPSSKIISLPTDKEYRGEVAAQSRKNAASFSSMPVGSLSYLPARYRETVTRL